MPTSTSAFSVKANFRLEFSVNLIGWAPGSTPGTTVGIHELVVGIRRTSGADTDSGTGTISVGFSGGGDTRSFSYNFAGRDYVEIIRENWTRLVGSTNNWNATVSPAISMGTAAASVGSVPVPPPSPATVPSFTPVVFTAGTPISISWTGASSAYTHELYYSFGGIVDGYIDDALPQSSSGYSYTPPLSLITQIPNAPQAPYTITLVTKNGAVEVGRQAFTGTLMVPNSEAPTVNSYTVSDATTAVATEVGKFVQGLSKIRLDSVDATPKSGATIVNTRLTVEGLDLRVADTKQLLTSGTVPLLARAWDSRGLSGSSSGSIDVLPYNAPTVTGLAVERTDSGGTPVENGAYLKVSATAAATSLMNTTERNSLTVKVETRPYGTSSWTVRNTITPGTLTYSTPFVIAGGAIFDNNGSYDVRYTASDKFNNTVVIQTVATGNVTVDMVGAGVGVGKLWGRGALDVGGRVFSTLTAMKQTGTLAERDDIVAKPGDEWFDTATGLRWEYVGSTWFLIPGQVLAQMEHSTNVTGAAGTLVGTVISTPTLPIGQQVKISASYSQYGTAASTASFVLMNSRNNAANVSYAAYTKRTGTRGYSTTASAVHSSSAPSHFLTATSADKISAAIYLASATTGVFGADLIQLWIESA